MPEGKYTRAEMQKIANDAVRYLTSPEGQMKLRERDAEREQFMEQLRQMYEIPHELLHRPFTI